MLELPSVTLVAITDRDHEATEMALERSQEGIEYGEVKFLTPQLGSLEEYSRYVLFELTKHIDTPYCLLIQYDSWVLNPEKWTDEFLDWDYIGAPWPPEAHYTEKGVEVRVGNGGFSLRSKRLLDAFNELQLPFTDGGKGFTNEDGQICNYYRHTLEDYGIKFAPVEVAARFSRELKVPETVQD